MKVSEVNQSIVGRRVKGVFSAMTVTGVIDKIQESDYTVEVHIVLDKPVQWGDDEYTSYWSTARKEDGWGNLEHTELLEDLSWLADYQPKDEQFTSFDEIAMITDRLGLAGLSDEELQEKRNEVVRFYHERKLNAYSDRKLVWKLTNAMMSVTAAIDYHRVQRRMEV